MAGYDVPSPGPGWKKNPGYRPRPANGKRIRVVLNHGREGACDNNPMSPPGWAADRCNWKDRDHDFGIAWYLIL